MRIAFVVGYNGAVLGAVGRAVEELKAKGIDLVVWASYLPNAHPDDVAHHLGEADAVFLYVSPRHTNVASLLSGGGVITDKQAILTLLLGSMVVITMINIRYSIPFNVSLFGRLGLKLTAVNYACSMGAKVVCILLVLALL